MSLLKRDRLSRQPRETHVEFPFDLMMTDRLRTKHRDPSLFAQLENTPFTMSFEGESGSAYLKSWHTSFQFSQFTCLSNSVNAEF